MIKAVLFDLDGTFADTAPDLAAATNHVRAQHGLSPLPLDVLRPQASHGSAGLLRVGMNIMPEHPDFPELREQFLVHYTAHICDHTRLFTGMAELIDELEQRNLPWGIVTNKPHRFTLPLMHALGYSDRTHCLVSGDSCTHAKPHPEPMLYAAKLLSVDPQHCLYLGDDRRDMEAAQAANMQGIVATYGYVNADWPSWPATASIQTPQELILHLNK